MSSFTEKVKDAAGNVGDSVKNAAHTVGEKVVGAKDAVVDKFSSSDDKTSNNDTFKTTGYEWKRDTQDVAYHGGNLPRNAPYIPQAQMQAPGCCMPNQPRTEKVELDYNAQVPKTTVDPNIDAKGCAHHVRLTGTGPHVLPRDPMLS